MVATGLLLTGMVAFALVTESASPVDAIPSVVTDRPVQDSAVVAPPTVKIPVVVAVPKPTEAAPVASGFTSRLITTARRSVRAAALPKPVVVPKAIVVVPRPKADSDPPDLGDDDDHEVVKPDVRDDTDDEDDDDHKEPRRTDSPDQSDDESKPALFKEN